MVWVTYIGGSVTGVFVGEKAADKYQADHPGCLVDLVPFFPDPDPLPTVGEPKYMEAEFRLKVRRDLLDVMLPEESLEDIKVSANRFGRDFPKELLEVHDGITESVMTGFVVLDDQGRKVDIS